MENLNTSLYSHPIAIYKLNDDEKKLISKLKKSGVNCDSALNIISLSDNQINDLIGFTNDTSLKESLTKLKEKLTSSSNYIRTFIAPISTSSIERELLECLNLIDNFTDFKKEIFFASISSQKEEKFENLSKKYKKTLKSINKLSESIYQELREVFYYRIDKYKNYLKSLSGSDIRLEMPTLYSEFSNEDFYNFIKCIFDLKDDASFSSSTKIDNIDIDECFDNIFQEVVLPCSIDTFRNSFYEYEGFNYSQINNLVPKIQEKGLITIENKKVVSACLTFKTAIIQLLLQEKREIPWNEIIEKITQKGLFHGEPLSQEEFENNLGLYSSVIKSSEDSFVHVNYSNLTMEMIDRCIDKINSLFTSEEISKLPLDKIHSMLNEKITLFELQHILFFMN